MKLLKRYYENNCYADSDINENIENIFTFDCLDSQMYLVFLIFFKTKISNFSLVSQAVFSLSLSFKIGYPNNE